MIPINNRGVVVLLGLFFYPAYAFSETAQETLKKLHQTYETVQTLQADFTQTVFFHDFDRAATSTGKFFFKKGTLRWDYQTPHQQQILISGRQILHYMPENQQAVKGPLGNRTGLPIDLFTGLGNLQDLFHITGSEEKILLAPKEAGAHVVQIMLFPTRVFRIGLVIQKITLYEENKNRSLFLFDHFKANSSFRNDPFILNIPKGVEVIEAP